MLEWLIKDYCQRNRQETQHRHNYLLARVAAKYSKIQSIGEFKRMAHKIVEFTSFFESKGEKHLDYGITLFR